MTKTLIKLLSAAIILIGITFYGIAQDTSLIAAAGSLLPGDVNLSAETPTPEIESNDDDFPVETAADRLAAELEREKKIRRQLLDAIIKAKRWSLASEEQQQRILAAQKETASEEEMLNYLTKALLEDPPSIWKPVGIVLRTRCSKSSLKPARVEMNAQGELRCVDNHRTIRDPEQLIWDSEIGREEWANITSN